MTSMDPGMGGMDGMDPGVGNAMDPNGANSGMDHVHFQQVFFCIAKIFGTRYRPLHFADGIWCLNIVLAQKTAHSTFK